MNTTATQPRKITMATVKSFVKKNRENLFITTKSRFNSMSDMVESDSSASFQAATPGNINNTEHTLGIAGAWFVGQSRDYLKSYEDILFTGIEVYNCCGSFILAVKK